MPRTASKSTNTAKETSTPAKTTEQKAAARARVERGKTPYKVRTELPLNAIITVRNGFNGKLVYVSPRTKEKFVWESFGDEQDMELQELKNARNSCKKFFENNWFMISDPEVISFLGVEQYYKHALTIEEFDTLFEMTPEAAAERISQLSSGQKASVKYRAKQLIANGMIDSIKMITALENSLGVELIER